RRAARVRRHRGARDGGGARRAGGRRQDGPGVRRTRRLGPGPARLRARALGLDTRAGPARRCLQRRPGRAVVRRADAQRRELRVGGADAARPLGQLMAHDHQHAHGISPETQSSALKTALALIVAFMIAEVVAGILASSLALLSDAAHMLTDAAALLLSLTAARLATKPAHGSLTYGLGRAEILSAQANGITLLVLALLILYAR